MYAIFEQLLRRDGLTISEVGRATGISPSTFTDWRAGRYKPKADKMKRIADYFGVSVDYLTTGKDTPKESASGKIYYFNDETAAAAQEMFDDPDLRRVMENPLFLGISGIFAPSFAPGILPDSPFKQCHNPLRRLS